MNQKLDRAVGVIVNEGKILLLWRFRDDREYYVIHGGTNEVGESLEETLEREISEELNLKVSGFKKLFDQFNDYVHPRTDHYYLIEHFEGDIKMGSPELTSQTRQNIYRPEWVEISKIDSINLQPAEIIPLLKEQLA